MADLGVHPHVPVEGDVVGLLEGEGEGEGRLLEPAGALGGEGGGRDELGVHVVEGERLEAHTHGAGGRAGRLEVRLRLAVQQRVHDHHVVCEVRSLKHRDSPKIGRSTVMFLITGYGHFNLYLSQNFRRMDWLIVFSLH